MSKIAVEIIAVFKGTGNRLAAHGRIIPPHDSGFLKINTPIQIKVMATPTLKM
ncbi:hypothetical protein HYW82_00070 [Candidatus Peregrinibacteria bacterium]|nr:hypothetical protein [Candidatus Peregrinibacteria bacterium]